MIYQSYPNTVFLHLYSLKTHLCLFLLVFCSYRSDFSSCILKSNTENKPVKINKKLNYSVPGRTKLFVPPFLLLNIEIKPLSI